jgi:hypothetical protein
MICGTCALASSAAAAGRYVAVFADGTRTEGDKIQDWFGADPKPKLNDTLLLTPQRPLRWLCDQSLLPAGMDREGAGFVEMVNGDRLPGTVVDFDEGAAGNPPHLVVMPTYPRTSSGSSGSPHVRVRLEAVRRVVVSRLRGRFLEPGTIFFPDGRRLPFRAVRWQRGAVRVLAQEGVRQVPLGELAEIHLAQTDPWQGLCEELATVNPELTLPMVRLECTRGIIATTSQALLRADGSGPNEPRHWSHAVQPWWSLDPIWIPFNAIRMRSYFSPNEAPLSRLAPAKYVDRRMFGGAAWQVDRNVEGGPLQNALGPHGWGFAVHAPCQLWFDLPPAVSGFRSRVGLDGLAGQGGCARALVFLNRADGTPLFRSKNLIGSSDTDDTKDLALTGPAGTPKKLVLVADAAERDAPAGADPLDIRDMLDWIEPVLQLDVARLKAAVQEALPATVPCWRAWTRTVEGGATWSGQVRLDPADGNSCRASRGLSIGRGTLGFSLERELSEADAWLVVRLKSAPTGATVGRFEVRVDGKPFARFDAPAQGAGNTYCVPLHRFVGQKVKLQVLYTPTDAKEFLEWQDLRLSDRVKKDLWRPTNVVNVRSLGGAALTPQEDRSIVVGDPRPDSDVMVISAESDLPQINAVSLEVLPEAAPPREGQGPALPRPAAFTLIATSRNRVALRGRYVRVERPKSPKPEPLALGEVEVFSGDENVANRGKASQSSVEGEAVASRAIDDNRGVQEAAPTWAQTKPGDAGPWWELDLGENPNQLEKPDKPEKLDRPLDRIVLWSRADGKTPNVLAVRVLDSQRKQVWEKNVDGTAFGCQEILLPHSQEVRLREFVAPPSPAGASPAKAPAGPAVSPSPRPAAPRPLVFALEQSLDPREKAILFTLRTGPDAEHRPLRFRISVSPDRPPFAPDPPGVEVPLLP